MESYGFERVDFVGERFLHLITGISGGGGGGENGFVSKRTPEFEDWASSGIARRVGIKQVENPEWTSWNAAKSAPKPMPYGGDIRARRAAAQGYMGGYGDYYVGSGGAYYVGSGGAGGGGGGGKEPSRYTYDTSQAGAPISREAAISPYKKDLDLLGKANEGFQNPAKLTQTYNPFNFQGLPEQYGDKAFASGSKDVRRQGQGDLQAIQEAVGTRRPGLLLKAGQRSQRDVGEQLAKMRSDIDLNVMDRNLDVQRDQAAENYKGYESRSNLEKGNADEAFRYLQGLQGGAAGKIGLESGITQQERGYQDEALKYLLGLYDTASGQKTKKSSYNLGLDFT